ncbi:hypothetical protein LCGC14_0583300 [marine sediment metagenome]|uniref:Uncharacterized protein n=1 Tax=marine sediment metagenome TaxID=412755 RepID=A0A0F9RFR6_9ZZZZ
MSIRLDFLNYVKARPAIIAVVTNTDGEVAVYHNRPSQEQNTKSRSQPGKAYVTVSKLSTQRFHDLDLKAGLASASYQVESWSDDPNTLDLLAEAVRDELDGRLNTTMGSSTVQSVVLESELDRPEFPGEGRDISINRIIHDYRVSFQEALPAH